MCVHNDPSTAATQECLDTHLLTLLSHYPGSTRYLTPVNTDDGWHYIQLQLPDDVTCTQCVLQWKYQTGETEKTINFNTILCIQCCTHVSSTVSSSCIKEGLDFNDVELFFDIFINKLARVLAILSLIDHSGNSWGVDPDTGEGCVGCGAQEEFYACSDIKILRTNNIRSQVSITTPSAISTASCISAFPMGLTMGFGILINLPGWGL